MTATKKGKEIAVKEPAPRPEQQMQIAHAPDMLLTRAIEKGVDIQQLEKLMEMHEKWLARKAKAEYYDAFSLFQSLAPDLKKNKLVSFGHKTGPGETSYKYQELGDISAHIREPLAQCGLSYNWIQQDLADGSISVTCVIRHRGGHEERGEPLTGRPDDSGKKNNIQQKASTITYLKRYTLIGILGLSSTDVDDDGRASGNYYPDAQVMPDNGLPLMTDIEFDKASEKFMEGKWNMDFVKKAWNITQAQEDAFNVLLQNKK